MPNLRDIRRRIRSVKNTAQITKAMELVAASKMKRAQETALAGRPYAELMAEFLQELFVRRDPDRKAEEIPGLSPLFRAREVQHRGILLITPDKGLCGPLISNLLRLVTEIPREQARFVCIGRKGASFISRTKRELLAEFSVHDKVPFGEIRPAVELMLKAFHDGEIDTVEVAFTRYFNTLRQDAMLTPLVPIRDLAKVLETFLPSHQYTAQAPIDHDQRRFLFEPDPVTILNDLIELFVRREVYQMVLEAKASEHCARRVAMKTATDNAKELVERLTLQYNKVRQSAITQEILEIAAASFAQTSH